MTLPLILRRFDPRLQDLLFSRGSSRPGWLLYPKSLIYEGDARD